MRRLAHIVNPVAIGEQSDLHVAQPITFESMRAARRFASTTVQVEQYTAQYAEDHAFVPTDFDRTPDLERSVLDVGAFATQRKLPLVGDILRRLRDASDADYFIYTNVDIALMPSFYSTVSAIIDSGIDAFVINRRTLPARYQAPAQLPLMYAEIGESHRGYDCFVFPRGNFERFELGNVCIGVPKVGVVLAANMICFARSFHEFRDLHLTFHLGTDRPWRDATLDDYRAFNTAEAERIMTRLAPLYDLSRLPAVGLPWLSGHFQRLRATAGLPPPQDA